MAFAQLVHRLLGISAICLAAIATPLTPVQRMLVLTALSLGVGMASVRPAYDRIAARLVGPAVLVLAVIPSSALWGVLALSAVGVIGFASFNQAGMSRVVPALGLPIMTIMFRSGHGAPRGVLLAWIVAIVLATLWGSRADLVTAGPRLGDADSGPDTDWRRLLRAITVVLIIAPVSLVLAIQIDRIWPDSLGPPPRPGDRSAAGQEAHPGLNGGLDTGAPVLLDDEIVLRVKTDQPLYWRGTTYTHWDGRHWTSDVGSEAISWTSDGVDLAGLWAQDEAPAPPGVELPAPIAVTQHFTAERAGLDVILGAWRIDTVRTTEREATVGDDGTVSIPAGLGAGATWTTRSLIVPATADDLRRADPVLMPADHPLRVRYGQEDSIVPAVAELARSITENAPTTYDKVLALEAWMDANIEYTRAIDRLAPASDAVNHLLFESRQGYCEQIGSALVVMLRSLGVPARLVVGYVPSEYDAATGEWLSRGTDAHAWAEVYFPGVGWQGFDPTAGVPLASVDAPSPLAAGRSSVFAAGLAVAVLAVLAAASRIRRWLAARSEDVAVSGLGRLRDRFDQCGLLLDRRWHEAMTIREKGQDLLVAGADASTVGPVVRSLEQLLFSTFDDDGPAAEDLVDLDAALARLEVEVQAQCDPQESALGRRSLERSR